MIRSKQNTPFMLITHLMELRILKCSMVTGGVFIKNQSVPPGMMTTPPRAISRTPRRRFFRNLPILTARIIPVPVVYEALDGRLSAANFQFRFHTFTHQDSSNHIYFLHLINYFTVDIYLVLKCIIMST